MVFISTKFYNFNQCFEEVKMFEFSIHTFFFKFVMLKSSLRTQGELTWILSWRKTIPESANNPDSYPNRPNFYTINSSYFFSFHVRVNYIYKYINTHSFDKKNIERKIGFRRILNLGNQNVPVLFFTPDPNPNFFEKQSRPKYTDLQTWWKFLICRRAHRVFVDLHRFF